MLHRQNIKYLLALFTFGHTQMFLSTLTVSSSTHQRKSWYHDINVVA